MRTFYKINRRYRLPHQTEPRHILFKPNIASAFQSNTRQRLRHKPKTSKTQTKRTSRARLAIDEAAFQRASEPNGQVRLRFGWVARVQVRSLCYLIVLPKKKMPTLTQPIAAGRNNQRTLFQLEAILCISPAAQDARAPNAIVSHRVGARRVNASTCR